MKHADLHELTHHTSHRFAKLELLEQALTHPSGASPSREDNQRLEFLGDRVLGRRAGTRGMGQRLFQYFELREAVRRVVGQFV